MGLNIYSFKYGDHDPQIGRFWQIDPLSEGYVHNSTYAFSEHHVTSHVELEGLEKAYYLRAEAWRAAKREFINTADQVDKFVRVYHNSETETQVGNTAVYAGTETKTIGSTSLKDFMSYVIAHNSNNGYNGKIWKSTTETNATVKTKLQVKTKNADVDLSISTDKKATKKFTGGISGRTANGLKVGMEASRSSDETKTVGGKVSADLETGTTISAKAEVSIQNEKTNVDIGVSVEQEIGKTKYAESSGIIIGPKQ